MKNNLEWRRGKMEVLQMLYLLGMTLVFSWLIGLERQNIGKAAGISAHVLIAMSACVAAILQRNLFLESGSSGENQRLISQFITGIGVVGAGVILKSEKRIKGLTTASTLWYCAIIGITIGSGYWVLGLIAGGFSVLFLYIRDIVRKINPFKKNQETDNDN